MVQAKAHSIKITGLEDQSATTMFATRLQQKQGFHHTVFSACFSERGINLGSPKGKGLERLGG